ncbi:MAG: ATP-binding protein [Muribaculaceae bacterium]|nr:ATP-binding protein [Muribaculaceae bacterium]MBR1725153.1 ATP-binding protein [Muribaculaceae bacterium]
MIGRESEINKLMQAFQSENSEFVAVYGRRRIGKTYLVRETLGYNFTFSHTGMAHTARMGQLQAWRSSLIDSGLADAILPKNWIEAFDELKRLVRQSTHKRKVLFIDEMPWLDTQHSGFVAALEYFYNGWCSARKDIVLIACGSATSWIINKVINGHGGLHNRVTHRIALEPFSLAECQLMAQSKGLDMTRQMIAQCYMIMGGVPYYWSLLQRGKSLAQNIDNLFFSATGELHNEFDNLFNSLFSSPKPYLNIIRILGTKGTGMTRAELIEHKSVNDNGHLQTMLRELEYCGFIRSYRTYGKKSRDKIFQLIDCFTIFYFKFLEDSEQYGEHYWSQSQNQPSINNWLGLAFERLCLLHVNQLKRALGVSGIICSVGAWRSAHDKPRAQVDLVIDRHDDVIDLCEMKYYAGEFEIDAKYERTLSERCLRFIEQTHTRKAVHIVFVTTYGLKANMHSDIVQNTITLDQLFHDSNG